MDYGSDSSSSSDEGVGYYHEQQSYGYGYPHAEPQPLFNSDSHETVDESWSVRELKHECWRNGLRNFRRLNKGALIRLLNGAVSPPSPPTWHNEAPSYLNEPAGHTAEATVDESWSKRELRTECFCRGIRKFTRLSKYELIRLLNHGERPRQRARPRPRPACESVAPSNAWTSNAAPANPHEGAADAAPTNTWASNAAPTHSYGGTSNAAPTHSFGGTSNAAPTNSWTANAAPANPHGGAADAAPTNTWTSNAAPTNTWTSSATPTNSFGGTSNAAPATPYDGSVSVNVNQTSSNADSSPHSDESTGRRWETRGAMDEPWPVEARLPPIHEHDGAAQTVRYGTSAIPHDSGGYGGHPNQASPSPYSNERTGHSEEQEGFGFVGGAWPAEARGHTSHDDNIKKEREKRDDSNTCIVCMDNEVNCTLVPCGHHCTCVNCAAEFEQCPVCRRKVDQKIKTFGA